MNENICPICKSDKNCKEGACDRNGFVSFYCDTYKVKYNLADEIIYMNDDQDTRESLLDLVAEQLTHQPYCKSEKIEKTWYFFYNPDYIMTDDDPKEFINLADRINNYPNTTMDFINRGLLNLSYRYPHYGDIIDFTEYISRLIYERNNNSFGIHGIVDLYEEMGLLKKISVAGRTYTITADGWQKIDELRKKEITVKQAFIAMRFGKETNDIRDAFREAINQSGFSPMLIDEKEHNNQIVPEILYEIRRSRFMVVDITFPNYGAYYEAGYGQALGKEVIICCRKQEFDSTDNRPHFDIAQKSMIVWNDKEELVNRLKKRIEATVK